MVEIAEREWGRDLNSWQPVSEALFRMWLIHGNLVLAFGLHGKSGMPGRGPLSSL